MWKKKGFSEAFVRISGCLSFVFDSSFPSHPFLLRHNRMYQLMQQRDQSHSFFAKRNIYAQIISFRADSFFLKALQCLFFSPFRKILNLTYW